MHTYIHTYIHYIMFIHTYIHTYIHRQYMPEVLTTHTLYNIHTYIHTYTHIHRQYMPEVLAVHTLYNIHTYIHTYIHTPIDNICQRYLPYIHYIIYSTYIHTLWFGNCSLKAAARPWVVSLPHCLSVSPWVAYRWRITRFCIHTYIHKYRHLRSWWHTYI